MYENDFKSRLSKVTQLTLESTREIFSDFIPNECVYLLEDDYKQWSFASEQQRRAVSVSGRLSADEVVKKLLINGQVPESITVCLKAVERGLTLVRLGLRGEYNFVEEQLPHYGTDIRPIVPFRVRLPVLPKGWIIKEGGIPDLKKSVEVQGKLKL